MSKLFKQLPAFVGREIAQAGNRAPRLGVGAAARLPAALAARIKQAPALSAVWACVLGGIIVGLVAALASPRHPADLARPATSAPSPASVPANPLSPPAGPLETRPLYCAGTSKPYVALTFDDGPGPQTQRTIDELRHAGQRATFFSVGRVAQLQPGVAKSELAVGAVGDHTWNHADLARLPTDHVSEELAQTQSLLSQQTDRPITLMRPPYGAYNQNVVAEAQKLGMRVVLWNVDSRDSEGARADQIAKTAIAGLLPGSIILFHENKPQTQLALSQVLAALAQHGLTSVSIPELLALDPPSAQQLQQGPRGCPLPGLHPQGHRLSPTA